MTGKSKLLRGRSIIRDHDGIVRDASDGSPVGGAQVLAVAGETRSVVATAATDAEGRYLLRTSEPRFELTADALGRYVVRVGDVDGELAARACPAPGDCGRVDLGPARRQRALNNRTCSATYVQGTQYETDVQGA